MASSTDNKLMKRLFLRVLYLSLPISIILLSYFYLDPFKVLYQYRDYSATQVAILNRDYVSTQTYLNNVEKLQYNSFIFGNSRTLAFRVRDWVGYIGPSSAFHYDASNETIYGIWQKLLFLKRNKSKIDNALIICDHTLLREVGNSEGHLFRKDPRLTGESALAFQTLFVKAYLSNLFFYQYSKRLITGLTTPEMAEMLEGRQVLFDRVTNDYLLPDIDKEIMQDSIGFYNRNTSLQVPTKSSIANAVIGPAQQQQLTSIANIFAEEKTNFQIVISPLFGQVQLNPIDVAILQKIFGADKVHDFSGKNSITTNPGNYYEQSHYRPFVGRQILNQIYSGR